MIWLMKFKIIICAWFISVLPQRPSQLSEGMFDSKHRIWGEKVCVLADILHNKEKQEEIYAREVLRQLVYLPG